ncbi:MAG: hypothetical protein HQL34_05505 [Alphaproteobacteria bacterium]|nr:hypothetical protein [Alphaproteobacteria bacterium]
MARRQRDGDNEDDAPGQIADPLSRADAARAVGIAPEEVLSFKDYGSRIVVVTTSGRRLEGTP